MIDSNNKEFIFDQITVFFKHTDLTGNVQYTNYFDWSGFTREAFFQETVSNFREVASRPIKMMTVHMSHEIFDEARFGDKIEARLKTSRIKKFSFDMIIRYIRKTDKKLLCFGKHTVVFVNSGTGKFVDIPSEMMNVIVCYKENDGKPKQDFDY